MRRNGGWHASCYILIIMRPIQPRIASSLILVLPIATGCAAVVSKPSEPLHERPDQEETAEAYVERRAKAVEPVAPETPQPTVTPRPEKMTTIIVLDTNADGVVAEDEMRTDSEAQFLRLDVNADGTLDRTEASTFVGQATDDATFEAWDGDGNGSISQAEFVEHRFSAYDGDGDRTIDEVEVEQTQPWEGRWSLSDPDGGHPGY